MTNLALVVVLAFIPSAAGFNLRAAASFGSKLSLDMEAGATPVAKVVNLLKDMQKELEKEAEEDEATYDKIVCWCNTNDKEKTKSIKQAEIKISELTTSIEEGTATSARLNTEIANHEKEVAANKNALDQAQAMRTKDLAEFTEEEKDLLQSIGALKNAIAVLAKHHGGAALLQTSAKAASQLKQAAAIAKKEMDSHAALLEGVLTKTEKKKVAMFAQDQSKAPASGEIFGILKAMKESFEQNLAQSQKDEGKGVADFADLKASKEEEIAAGTDAVEKKTQELAKTDEQLAQDKVDLDDTTASLSEDEKFLMNLKETCAMNDSEYEQRVKERQLEIEAVSKALEILTSDDAHDLFTKTFSLSQEEADQDGAPSLMQMGSASQRQKRKNEASKLLAEVAKNTGNPRLSALAVKVRLDSFKRVIKAIDDMIAELMQEKKDEIKHRDYCIAELNTNEANTERKDREKADVLALIEDLTVQIDTLTKEIATLKTEISDMQLQLKHAGEDRELANNDFKQVVADQRATQTLLKQALDVLKAVYAKKMALMQKQTPPAAFKKFEKNKKSGGVMGMIQDLIDEAKALETDAIRAEDEAQKAYEDFVKDTNASIEEKSKLIVTKSEEKAKAEEDKTVAEETRDKIMLDLEQLSNQAADLHKACDFVLKNFDIRQTARDQEVEALKQAKAILSGAKFIQVLKTGFRA